MNHTVVLDEGIPKTRYTRIGMFSARPRSPQVDRVRKIVRISFPTTPRLAYLFAAAYGDGTIAKRRIGYFNSDPQWLESVAEELRGLTLSGHPRPRIFRPRGRTVLSMEYCNSALARLARGSSSARLQSVKTLTKSRALLTAFAAGMFDCEGSATIYINKSHRKGTPEISIANSDFSMLRVLQTRLGAFGITGGISLSAGPRKSVIEGRKVVGKKPVYRLRFSGWSSAIKFARFVLPWVKSRPKAARLVRIVQKQA